MPAPSPNPLAPSLVPDDIDEIRLHYHIPLAPATTLLTCVEIKALIKKSNTAIDILKEVLRELETS